MEENKDLQDQNTDIEKDIENAADETSVEFEEAAEENIEENVESETTDDSEKKGFSKKKKDKKDELIEELTDKYKRTFAEFDNFRKRSEKEKSAMYGVGAMDLIGKILPDEEREAPFADGMDKIYKQLLKSLEDLGVSEIEALGKEFDPNLHNAVMHIDDEELGDNVVAEVLQKGYMYKDSVVRHSMVKVAN